MGKNSHRVHLLQPHVLAQPDKEAGNDNIAAVVFTLAVKVSLIFGIPFLLWLIGGMVYTYSTYMYTAKANT